MLSREKLADIVRDEVENLIKKGKVPYKFYYILPNGEIYQADKYDYEVEEGRRSPNDIYVYGDVWPISDFDTFLFLIDYLDVRSVNDIVDAYLRKVGFTIVNTPYELPAPNLKYYIRALVLLNNDTPEYLGIEIYDIDSLARSFHIPQIVEQELGSQPREIGTLEFDKIYKTVVQIQPLLAGYAYEDVLRILYNHYVDHKKEYKNEANKIVLAYLQLFPTPYRVCYKWEARTFDKIDCLKIVIHSFSS